MPPPDSGSGESDHATPDKRELLAAFDGVVNRERERAVEQRSLPQVRKTHAAVLIICAIAWGSLAYTWLAQPAWLFPDDQAGAISAAQRDDRLRFAIYLERERVLDFRATHRRLPATLAEAGDVEDGVEYVVSGDSTFVVSAMVGDSLITLNESESADQLLKPAGLTPSVGR